LTDFSTPQGVNVWYPRVPRMGHVALCVVLKDPEKRGLSRFSGGLGEGETPLPIPNRAVKPLSADGTWPARAWESRTPPVSLDIRAAPNQGGPQSFWVGWQASMPFAVRAAGRNRPARAVQPRPDADRAQRCVPVCGEGARPGRPPSRRRSRPRATGTSGSGATRSRGAAPDGVEWGWKGTYVRTP
jgi:hypothetical protein